MGRLLDEDDVYALFASNGTARLHVADIDVLPRVDIKEVVHGQWIVRAELKNGEKVIAACSNCNVQGEVRTHRNEWGIWRIHSPYCPNCGAKMDLED